MINERALKAYELWSDESQRFDYFILGLIGAVTAYVAQNLKPEKLGWSPFTLELVGLVLLIASAMCGFRRAESNIGVLKYTHQRLEWEAQLSSLVEVYNGQAVRSNLGEILSPEQAEKRAANLREAISNIAKLQEQAATASGRAYLYRNYLLLFGFLAVVISSVLRAYA